MSSTPPAANEKQRLEVCKLESKFFRNELVSVINLVNEKFDMLQRQLDDDKTELKVLLTGGRLRAIDIDIAIAKRDIESAHKRLDWHDSAVDRLQAELKKTDVGASAVSAKVVLLIFAGSSIFSLLIAIYFGG